MRKKKSLIFEAVHQTAKGLHEASVMDQITLNKFERLCLPLVEPLTPEQIKLIYRETNDGQNIPASLLT